MGYELNDKGIYEVAAKAVQNLCTGVDTLKGRSLTGTQVDELAEYISDIEEAALEFDKLARRLVVAENATTTSEEESNG